MKNGMMIVAFAIAAGLNLCVQAQPDPSQMPKDHFVRSQIDGYMSGDVNMITDHYHPGIILTSYPGNVLSEGLEAAKKYWKEKFEAEKERTVEPGTNIDLGDKVICNFRQHNAEKGIMVDKAFIIEIKEDKIIRVMMID